MSKTTFVCQSCGAVYPKWVGKCEECHTWGQVTEEQAESKSTRHSCTLEVHSLAWEEEIPVARLLTASDEFNRVCGGGFVPGSVILLGGDPGIGKSTLLLQVMGHLSAHTPALYVSGEEAVGQVRLRAQRLSLSQMPLKLASSTHLQDIIKTLEKSPETRVVVIDSIQTMASDSLDSAPGTVGQVRACAQDLIRFAKKRNVTVILVGHVTKEGTLAGPRVLEHMVDTVLYFEGERGHQFRILRSVKNRFGATDEIGVFEMTESGLQDVPNPSHLFLGNRTEPVSGSAVFAGIEGTRPLLVEFQALVAPSSYGVPRRAVVGWDAQRLSMILAVLEARCGLSFGNKDVYLNVAGGLKITEPAADLAVAAALISCTIDQALSPHLVLFGEISLAGEVRPVSHGDQRLKEAQKLGFLKAVVPATQKISLDLHVITRLNTLVTGIQHRDSAFF